MTRQQLARGTTLRVSGDTWIIQDDLNPGFVFYAGSAEGALAYIEKKELQP